MNHLQNTYESWKLMFHPEDSYFVTLSVKHQFTWNQSMYTYREFVYDVLYTSLPYLLIFYFYTYALSLHSSYCIKNIAKYINTLLWCIAFSIFITILLNLCHTTWSLLTNFCTFTQASEGPIRVWQPPSWSREVIRPCASMSWRHAKTSIGVETQPSLFPN